MASQILRPNFRSLAALLIVLAAAAVLAFALLAGHEPTATVATPAAPPAAPTVVQVAPDANTNSDLNLPICKRHGGPTC
jgi:hypothetical protein